MALLVFILMQNFGESFVPWNGISV